MSGRPALPDVDRLISLVDQSLRTLFATPRASRLNPALDCPQEALSEAERHLSASLMRVNHSGEIAAQALYEGQALVARDPGIRDMLKRAALEETDHLVWTQSRISELGGRTSLLNPLWYSGGLAMGVAFGLVGDRWNLGFLVETERQVEAHLASHQGKLPAIDAKSHAIVAQMKNDEAQHATAARRAGAAELPAPARAAMRAAGRVLTGLSRLF